MPRKKTQRPAADSAALIDQQQLAQDAAAADVNSKRLAEIDATYGDGLPYDLHRLIHETRFYLQQSAEALLEAGKRLVVLKEHEPSGEFYRALEQIGIAPRAAQKMMQAAVKFSGAKAPLAQLGKTKLLELLSEDDEELEALADGGTLAGHTLDDIERMSAADLRAALRKERERRAKEAETHEKLLAAKDRNLNELDKKIHDKEHRTHDWPAQVFDLNTETTVIAAEALQALDRLDQMREVITTTRFDDGDDGDAAMEQMAVVYFDAVAQIVGRLGEVMHDCEEVFGGYKDRAKPMLELYLQEQQEAAGHA